jgi:hypothetical protein
LHKAEKRRPQYILKGTAKKWNADTMPMLNSLSGYPEWLPEDRMVEQKFLQTIQETFELFGFVPLETRSVEPLDVILSKGETDKEIYCLRRLQAQDNEADKGIGLHFDLTVPFARYVMENRSKLTFPFRRYQIQKAWRGERPGLGRFREFLQADIDITPSRAPPSIASPQTASESISQPEVDVPDVDQALPKSADLKTPLFVPANRIPSLTASALTIRSARPALAAVQFVPLFAIRKTPPSVPANKSRRSPSENGWRL